MKNQSITQKSVLISLLVGFVLAACAPLTPQSKSAAPTVTGSSPNPAATQTPLSPALNSTQVPKLTAITTLKPRIAPTLVPVVGEVPSKVMDAVLQDLERRTGKKPENVEITRSEFITWNDGSMGCPKPGMSYTMATIDGYWVVLQVNSKQYDYRISAKSNTLLLCEK